jgi:hypothetical protein
MFQPNPISTWTGIPAIVSLGPRCVRILASKVFAASVRMTPSTGGLPGYCRSCSQCPGTSTTSSVAYRLAQQSHICGHPATLMSWVLLRQVAPTACLQLQRATAISLRPDPDESAHGVFPAMIPLVPLIRFRSVELASVRSTRLVCSKRLYIVGNSRLVLASKLRGQVSGFYYYPYELCAKDSRSSQIK